MPFLKALRSDESGATAIEYGLVVGLIFVVIVAAVGNLGAANKTQYNKITDAVNTAIP